MPSTDPYLYHFQPQESQRHPYPPPPRDFRTATQQATSNYIDLTDSSPATMPPKRRRRSTTQGSADSAAATAAAAAADGPSSKRARRARPSSPRPAIDPDSVDIINLEDDDPVAATLQRQREEQVKAQGGGGGGGGGGDEGPAKLTNLSCVICMDRPTDLTSTACGHWFCHECLIHALHSSENRSVAHGESRKSQCPVCRKNISKSKQGHVIPLLLMKKSKRAGGGAARG